MLTQVGSRVNARPTTLRLPAGTLAERISTLRAVSEVTNDEVPFVPAAGSADDAVSREALIAAEHERCRAVSRQDWAALDAPVDVRVGE
jgi:hypothetical protein